MENNLFIGKFYFDLKIFFMISFGYNMHTTHSKALMQPQQSQPIISNFKSDNCLIIRVDSLLSINIGDLSKNHTDWIRERLTIPNNQFLLLKKLGKSTWNTPAELVLFDQSGDKFLMPRGFLGELIRYCQKNNILFGLDDRRTILPPLEFDSAIKLRDYQKKALDRVLNYQFGVLVAPPGSGKTVMGIELIARLKQPSLILVHRKELLDQWVERVHSFLQIPKELIGIVGAGKKSWGQKVTVAMIQTLYTMQDKLPEIASDFGLVLVDECHHIPASTFSKVICAFNPYYMFGLTATPKRKNKDEKLIFLRIGQVITTIDPLEGTLPQDRPKIRLEIRNTDLQIPFDYSEHNFELLSKAVVFDSHRNIQIINDVLREIGNGKKILILTERKDHVELLNLYLQNHCQTLTLTGDFNKTLRNKTLNQVRKNDFQVLIATGQLMGEGVDISNLDCLFLVYPFSFEGKLIQYIGRIQRTKNEQVIYDYRDIRVDFLEKLFKKRHAYYSTL